MDFLRSVAGVLSFGLPLGFPDTPGWNFVDGFICLSPVGFRFIFVEMSLPLSV
jgi:hypothetical protein